MNQEWWIYKLYSILKNQNDLIVDAELLENENYDTIDEINEIILYTCFEKKIRCKTVSSNGHYQIALYDETNGSDGLMMLFSKEYDRISDIDYILLVSEMRRFI